MLADRVLGLSNHSPHKEKGLKTRGESRLNMVNRVSNKRELYTVGWQRITEGGCVGGVDAGRKPWVSVQKGCRCTLTSDADELVDWTSDVVFCM